MKYLALLRGINVGGKNKISMTELRQCFEELGYSNISTYINSGNVLFSSLKPANKLAQEIETTLVRKFKFDSEIIKTLVISENVLKAIIVSAPPGFGKQPHKYHSDVIFLIDLAANDIINLFELNPEVDKIWASNGLIYFQRLSNLRTKSRLNKIMSKTIYKQMTIRSWNTVTKLYKLSTS